MKRFGIRARLTLCFCFFSMILLVPFGLYFYEKEKDTSINELSHSMTLHGKILRTSIQDTSLSDQNIRHIVHKQAEGFPYRITVVGADGHVIADTWEDPLTITSNHKNREEVAAALQGKTAVAIRYSDTLQTDMLYTAIPLDESFPSQGAIRIAGSLQQVDELLRIHSQILGTGILTAILLSFGFGYLIARHLTRPLEEITASAENLTKGHLADRTHVRRNDEIGILAHSLNQLAASLSDKIQTLSAEKEKSQLILNQMENLVFLLNADGTIIEMNQAAIDHFHTSTLPVHHLQLVKNNLLETALQKAITSGQTQKILLPLAKKNYQAYVSPLKDHVNGALLLVLHDISAIEELYQRQSDFVANASHELSTPLSAIQGYAETLLDFSSLSKEEKERFTQTIYDEALRMSRLLNDLRQLARLESKDASWNIEKESVRFDTLVQEEMERFREEAAKKHLYLTYLSEEALPPIHGNPDWLRQGVANLISNAIHYTGEGGKIDIILTFEKDKLHFKIQDTGIGIPKEDLPKLFQRFFRVDRSRSRSEGGTGLGLAIVKHVVQLHHGDLWVESVLHEGSVFHLTLPV